MMFGCSKVINAAACFGPDAKRRLSNFVWFLKYEVEHAGDTRLSKIQDLARGKRLMRILEERSRAAMSAPSETTLRLPPRWLRTAHDDNDNGPEAA